MHIDHEHFTNMNSCSAAYFYAVTLTQSVIVQNNLEITYVITITCRHDDTVGGGGVAIVALQ